MSAAHLSPQEQVKEYYKVFRWLIALTVVEVAAVYLEKLHVPKLIVTLIIVVLSCSKAVLVGYYYMHLKHESKWIKIVALLPIIAFAYALVLGADYKIYHDRHAPSVYIPEPERKHLEHPEEVLDEVFTLEEATDPSAPESGALPVENAVDSNESSAAPGDGVPAAPANGEGGGGDWK